MPEGPEVRIFADCLAPLIGHTIINIEYTSGCPDKFKVFEIGDVLTDIYSHGKKLIFKLLRDESEHHLMNSVLMTGRWTYQLESYKFILTLIKDGEEFQIRYCDPRSLSLFKFGDETNLLSDVGPDWLQGVEYDYFYTTITNHRIRNQEICKFLMDQKYTAGIGNYLKAEILFETRLHPQQKIGSLTDDIIADLYLNIIEIITKAYESGGLTIQTYYDPFGRKGVFEPKVYGKNTLVNYSREYKVIKAKFSDGRSTHFVPSLQSLF